ncbi:MAG: DUF4270 domain-containing protein [Rikenellaceae bacterium]|nr:DUF4270 domain-containing protein [Rikenellaceae bacterium]
MRLFQRLSNIAAVLSVMLTVSCTVVDNELGEGMLPDAERMKLTQETITSIACYQGAADSVVTDDWTYPLLGSMVQPMDGLVECSMVAQFSPGFFESTDSMWGDAPVIDSVKLVMNIAKVYGDSSTVMNISIYDMIENLPYNKDSVRLSSYPAERKLGQLIHSFDITPKSTDITEYLPVSYAERFLDTTGRVFLDDTLFHKKFFPLYFKTNSVTNDGALMGIYPGKSYMYIYYHNHNKPTPDTASITMYFDNASDGYNEAFTVIRRNYDYADPLSGVNPDVIDVKEAQSAFFVTSLAGLTGRVVIDKSAIESLKERAEAMGYSQVAVNNASLVFPLKRLSTPSFDFACSELGLYYDYNKQNPTPDYENRLSGSSGFGGTLNRALEHYRMDVTSYVQRLLNGASDRYEVEVTPGSGVESSPSGVQLVEGVALSITYTMLK